MAASSDCRVAAYLNGEMKPLLLRYAFPHVSRVVFLVGPQNLRSRLALEKIGAVRAGSRRDAGGNERLRTPGNRGVQILLRREEDVAHFLVVTNWDSLDAVRAFAGAEIERARYYPEDDEYLLKPELYVIHYEVLGAE